MMTHRLAARMSRVRPSAIRELLRLGADPDVISFGGGYPDASLFPVEELDRVFRKTLAENGREALQYTVSNGMPLLRRQITERMTRDGVPCTAEEVLILQGGQQGLDLVAKMLIDKDDIIVVEDPTFLGALIAFSPYEPRYVTVGMDGEGMDVEALDAALKANPGAKFIYTVPDFQNPTGVMMSLARRKRLVEIANAHDLIILEDSPYREIRFEGASIPPIKSFDTEGRVIFLGSFSKVLAPGLRLGWAVASAELIEQLGLLKLAADTQTSTLNMAVASRFLADYDIDAHIGTIRSAYRHKKNLMLDSIRRSFPQEIACTDASGGLFTWLTFPEGFDAAAFMLDHALPEARVAYVPGATFFALDQRPNHARMSYSTQTDERLVAGITALGNLLKARMGSRMRG